MSNSPRKWVFFSFFSGFIFSSIWFSAICFALRSTQPYNLDKWLNIKDEYLSNINLLIISFLPSFLFKKFLQWEKTSWIKKGFIHIIYYQQPKEYAVINVRTFTQTSLKKAKQIAFEAFEMRFSTNDSIELAILKMVKFNYIGNSCSVL